MTDYEWRGYGAKIHAKADPLLDYLFSPFPKDIKHAGKKTGRMRRWLRRSELLRHQRRQSIMMRGMIMAMTPLLNFGPRISLHKRRKQSRGFVSNRKSDDKGVRVEWKTLSDTGDK